MAGGLAAFERLTAYFYDAVLAEPDPILEPVFRGMDPEHPRHVAAWLAETFGGPTTYTDELGGYEHMLAKHRNLALTEVQRRRWVAAHDGRRRPRRAALRPWVCSTFVAYLEWGTRIAVINSQPEATVTEHAPIPHWGWGHTPPFQPQPWDAPDAAEQGRQRYTQQQASVIADPVTMRRLGEPQEPQPDRVHSPRRHLLQPLLDHPAHRQN